MSDDAAYVRKLLRQQAALASFGSFALRQPDLLAVLTEAARVCAKGLNVNFAKVCRYREAENDLLIEAGVGWHEGVVGHVVSRADVSSPQGRAFVTGEPSICNDIQDEHEFVLPPFYAEHSIISTIDVIIKGSSDQPYGVLEIDSEQQQAYDEHDVAFLTGFANVLAEAVSTSERTLVLEATVSRMQSLVGDKDRLLKQKKVMAQELQHRVRNNLQLVYGMLVTQIDQTIDKEGQRGLKAIARRVSTLAQVYDQLLGTEMTRTMAFYGYVKALTLNLAEVQGASKDISVTCEGAEIILDLDVITALGIVVAELVTNSYDHAFPDAVGTISVKLVHAKGSAGATMIIADDGVGFQPQAESKRHGLGLIRRLVEQVRGTVETVSTNGTTWTVGFPVAVPVP
jgi:two-component sensor histidine kinase